MGQFFLDAFSSPTLPLTHISLSKNITSVSQVIVNCLKHDFTHQVSVEFNVPLNP